MRTLNVLALLGVLACAACGQRPLGHTAASPDALARAVLAALEERDASGLQALAVSEDEFEQRVWPGLPAARPERNMPWSYVWMELRQKSELTLKRTLRELGGRRYTLESVHFAGPTTTHGSFHVHRNAVFVVRDAAGSQQQLKIVGSLLQSDEGWKVFSYVND
jgi:hypothetical protein